MFSIPRTLNELQNEGRFRNNDRTSNLKHVGFAKRTGKSERTWWLGWGGGVQAGVRVDALNGNVCTCVHARAPAHVQKMFANITRVSARACCARATEGAWV